MNKEKFKIIGLVLSDLNEISNNGTYLSKMKCFLISHTFHMQVFIRIGCWVHKVAPRFGSPLRAIIEYLIRILFASDISCKATIGAGLFIMHGHDIVIGSKVIIGNRCLIMNSVTIGNKYIGHGVTNAQPVVGNDVNIGVGARVLGGIHIGDRSVIGANAVVLSDVPPDCFAIGIPARVIKRDP